MKKIYQKPTMKVVVLRQSSYLLTGSGYGDELSYNPVADVNSKA